MGFWEKQDGRDKNKTSGCVVWGLERGIDKRRAKNESLVLADCGDGCMTVHICQTFQNCTL